MTTWFPEEDADGTLHHPVIRTMICDCGRLLACSEGEFECPDCGLTY